MRTDFYVYEHWRPDTNECFYVGKGHTGRAHWMHGRNRHHTHIRKMLKRDGLLIEVRVVKDGLSEKGAFDFEIEHIATLRAIGAKLTNLTNGGDGPSGNQYRLGAVLSPETRAKISASSMGKTSSDEYKAKMAIATTGEKNGFYGKTHSAETRAKVAASNRRRVWTAEARAKISASTKSRPPTTKGKTWKLSEGTRRRQSEGMKRSWEMRRAADNGLSVS